MKKIISIIMSILLMTGIFAGCGNSSSKSTGDTKDKNVTLKFFNWYNNEGAPVVKKMVEKVKEKYPNITVELEMVNWDTMQSLLQTRIAANEMPDLIDFKGQDIPKYGEAGHLLDLTGKSFLSNVPAGTLESIKVNGKDYGLPYTGLYQGVFYNRNMFKDNGLEIPKTYADLMAIAEKLKAKGITPFATHFKDNWNIGNITMQFAMSEVFNKNPNWGKDLYAGKTTFASSPEYKLVFLHAQDQFKYTFKDTYSVDMAKCDEMFAKGQAAMYVTGTWSSPGIAQVDPKFDYGIFPFPGKDPGAKLIFEPDHTFAASAKTKYPDEVLKVLELVASDKELAKFCIDNLKTHSMLKDVMSTEKTPVMNDINDYKNKSQIVDVTIGNVQIKWPYQEEYSRLITEWLMNKMTIDDALKATDAYKDKVK